MEEGYIVILDPIPLFPNENVFPFYDGQPREDNGQFREGKRLEVALTTGLNGKIIDKEAEIILSKERKYSDCKGRNVVMTSSILKKYRDGIGRASTDIKRLRHLGRVILAIQSPDSEIVPLPNHHPPQRQYLHKFSKKGAIVVYVNDDDDTLRGFIYSSHIPSDRFLKNKRGR